MASPGRTERVTVKLARVGKRLRRNGGHISFWSRMMGIRGALVILLVMASRASAVAVTGEWVRPTGGTWWDSTNWSELAVPRAADDEALFLDTVTRPATVMVDGPAAVGTLYISNAQSLTFGGTQPLTLASDVGDAFVGVEAGSHTMRAPLRLRDAAVLHVLEPSVLTIEGPLSTMSGVEFAKVSSGGLRIMGPQSYAAGSLFIAIEGPTTMATDAGRAGAANLGINVENTAHVNFTASQHLAWLHIGGGFVGEDVAPVATLEANGGRVLWTAELMVHETGRLDLADNAMIVQGTAETAEAVLVSVDSGVAMGRDGGTWNGKGIGSSAAAARAHTGLVAMRNDRGDGTPLFQVFQGEAVDVNSILVKHTFEGDANLDGVINGDDYFRIDAGFLAQVAGPTYRDGDFNYDEVVNADDYFLIDSAFLGQGGVGGVGAALSAVAVPEPGMGVMGVMCGLLLMRRRGGGRRQARCGAGVRRR